jgi:hypothetical protein
MLSVVTLLVSELLVFELLVFELLPVDKGIKCRLPGMRKKGCARRWRTLKDIGLGTANQEHSDMVCGAVAQQLLVARPKRKQRRQHTDPDQRQQPTEYWAPHPQSPGLHKIVCGVDLHGKLLAV